MNKLRLPVTLIIAIAAAIFIQSCNKDTVSATAYTTASFQANIDGSTWAPDTVSSTIVYNTGAKTKTLTCSGTQGQKQVIFSITVPSTSATPGFPLATYNVDGNLVKAQYNTQQLSNGNYVFLPQGVIAAGAGQIVVTAVDSVKKTITGTFNFYSRATLYDGSGNVISTTVDNISAGALNAAPYVFTSN